MKILRTDLLLDGLSLLQLDFAQHVVLDDDHFVQLVKQIFVKFFYIFI